MIGMFITSACVSRGYGNDPALRFFDGEKGSSVHFRIGERVYDSRCKDNVRWINFNVKAFGATCERIRKMKLKEGSFVNITGRYDEDVKEDESTKETHKYPVVIVDTIEYCYNGGQKSEQDKGQQGESNRQPSPVPQAQYGASPQGQYNALPEGQYGGVPPQGQHGAPHQNQHSGQQPGTFPQGMPSAPPQGQIGLPPTSMPENFLGYQTFPGQDNPYF